MDQDPTYFKYKYINIDKKSNKYKQEIEQMAYNALRINQQNKIIKLFKRKKI